MEVNTKLFGVLEVGEEDVFEFPTGLFGFEEHGQFALILPDENLPFAYLQAVGEPSVALLVTDPFAFFPSYEFELPASDVAALRSPEPQAVGVWVTVSALEEDARSATANLLAPVVLNRQARVGRQVVLHESKYQTKVPLLSEKEGL